MSASVALVPVCEDRPAVVYVRGCAVRLDVRDADVRANERRFTQRIKEAHPDRQGSAEQVRRVIQERDAYRRQVAAEYAALGVEPLVPVAMPALTQCACGEWFRATKPAQEFCASYCPARIRALDKQRGMSRQFRCKCGRVTSSRQPDVTQCGACRVVA